jgi:lysophospholipase L1-like esterase
MLRTFTRSGQRVGRSYRWLAGLVALVAFGCLALPPRLRAQDEVVPAFREAVQASSRIVLLGDSITAAGLYATYVDAWIAARGQPHSPRIIDCGLPSETVSGLSEEGHADGQFPRPDLHERLDRVLRLTKPDLVIACYGINCGIYQPFDEGRFARYQQGIERLQQQVTQAGAKIVFLTPPFYDDQRAGSSWSYNGVLDQYSRWLVSQRERGWLVLDLHQRMTEEVRRRREAESQFTFQPDGVHPDEAGHWFIASQLILWLGDREASQAASPAAMLAGKKASPDLLPLVQRRVELLRDAYVGAAGHQRPGIAPGLPVAEADAQADQITRKIRELPAAP